MTTDPVEALRWAFNHSGDAWWVIGAIAAGVAWTSKRLGDWKRRNAVAVRTFGPRTPVGAPSPAVTAPAATRAASTPYAAAPSYQAPSYQAPSYAAQPAYAAPVASAATASGSRRPHREGAPAQRATAPVSRSVDVPARSGAWTVSGAFGDPANARTAIVVAEVLGPPLALR